MKSSSEKALSTDNVERANSKQHNRYRKIEIRMWTDEKFSALSNDAKLLWDYLLTGPHTSSIPGVLHAGRLALAESLGWDQDDFDTCFDEISSQKMVRADWKAQLVWLPKAIEHNSPASPNVIKSWRNEWDFIPNCKLKCEIFAALKAHVETLSTPYQQAFEACIAEPQKSAKPSGKDSQNLPGRKRKTFPEGIAKPSAKDLQNLPGISSSSSSSSRTKTQKRSDGLSPVRPTRAREATAENREKPAKPKTAEASKPVPAKAPSEFASVERMAQLPATALLGDDDDEFAEVESAGPLLGEALSGEPFGKAIAKPSRKVSQNLPERARPVSASAKADTAETWAAYADAYAHRYGTEPVRNATVNSQIAGFVKRIGRTEAPAVARFYVGHNAQFYVVRGHMVGLMLADAEKLRTEWATHRQTTASEAAMADRTQTNFNSFGPLIEQARAREEAERERH